MTALLVFLGSIFAAAADETSRRTGGGGGHLDVDAKVAEAEETFLPWVEDQIKQIADPAVLSDWKSVAARLPYLTEAVAMFFCMCDEKTPSSVKLELAGAFIYLVSPFDIIPEVAIPILGYADDATFLLATLYQVYFYVTPEHVAQAKEWLRGHGVEPKPIFALGKQFSPTTSDGRSGPLASDPQLPAVR